jgi:glucosylceramidase
MLGRALIRSRRALTRVAGALSVISIAALLLASAPAALGAGESVQTWLTTSAGASLINPIGQQAPQTFGPAQSAGTAVAVDPTTAYQSIAGFGGALTDSAAELIYNSPQRSQIMSALFGPGGADFNVVRVPMGATDLSLSQYTFDDACCSLSTFSAAPDAAYKILLLQQALQLDPGLKVIALPWSAPAWMKFGGVLTGDCSSNLNYLIGSYYPMYAQYFADFVAAYAAAGIPVAAVSMQNEPETCDSSYPTMNMAPADQSNFAVALRSALNNAGFGSVQIIAGEVDNYDGSAPTTYPNQVMTYNSGQADSAIGGVAYHCYVSPDGSSSVQSTFHNLYPAQSIYASECSSGAWATNAASNLVWEMQNNLIGPLRNWAAASLYWSLALDPAGGPHDGGCSDCRGMLTVDNGAGTYTENGEYYAWAQLSRLIEPGAVRISSPDNGNGAVQTVAFRNPDNSIALIALNSNATQAQPVHVDWAGQSFSYTLPATSVASFQWSPGGYQPYQLVSRWSGLCVDAAGWGTASGTSVQQWACGNGQYNQEWEFRPISGGWSDVLNRNAIDENLVWEVAGGSGATHSGTKIQLWSSTGGTNQQWRQVAVGNGYYELVVRNSNKCLAVPAGSLANRTQLVQSTCVNATNEQFSLVSEP